MGLEALRRAAEESPTLENLRALAAGIAAALRAIDTEAAGADLNEEQTTRWDALTTEHTATAARIETEERAARVRESRQKWQSTEFGSRVQPFDTADVRSLGPQEVRSRALAVLDSRDHAEHLSDDVKIRVSQLLRQANENVNGAHLAQRLLLTQNEHYREAFMRLVTRAHAVLSTEQAQAVQRFEEFRTMNITTDSAGGFGVPVLIDPTIILTAQGHPNDILGLARVETITTDTWKGVTSAGVTWKNRIESSTATDGSPTLAQPSVPVHAADGYIPFTVEVAMDYPGFASEMETLLREGYSEFVVQRLTVGTGVNQPTGIVTALDANTNVEVKVAIGGTLTAADVNKLWAALPIRYRNPASAASQAFMGSTSVLGVIQQLGEANDAAFTVGFTDEGVVRLKGRMAHENDYMPAMPIGTGSQNLLVVGDWRNFLVAQRAGMSIELVPHVLDTTTGTPIGQRAWWAWARFGSDSINDLGFRLLQNATNT